MFVGDFRQTFHHAFPQGRISDHIDFLDLCRIHFVAAFFAESDALSGYDLFFAFFIQSTYCVVIDNFDNFHKAPQNGIKKANPYTASILRA